MNSCILHPINFFSHARRALLVLSAAVLTTALMAVPVSVNPSLPAYQPKPVTPPKDAGYMLPDGSLQIIGLDDLEGVVGRLNELFIKSHPGFKFKFVKANNLSSFQSLVYDVTAFAPVGTEALGSATTPYEYIAHGGPFGIRVAHASLSPNAKVSPLGIVVNKANPIERLTTDQVTRIFTEGGRKRDITYWRQVGLKGDLATREIHSCGLPESNHYPSEDIEFADYMFLRKFGGSQSAKSYEMVPTYAEVVKIVSQDPLAIGITALNRVTPDVKVVPIVSNAWTAPSAGSAEDIISGKYAYDRYLYIFIRRTPDKPVDPFLMEYLKMVLSREGQETIAAEEHGYLPLDTVEVGEELRKL